jgi:predicted nucleic acid-binding protein
MNVLVDTNILLRSAEPIHHMHAPARAAVGALTARGDVLCVVPQVLYEFWVVATRPLAVNGLGWASAAADAEIGTILAGFQFLPDSPDVFTEWRALVAAHAVAGKTAHDARLVAAMRVHGLTHLLTFNDQDFRRFPAINALTPAAVTIPSPP